MVPITKFVDVLRVLTTDVNGEEKKFVFLTNHVTDERHILDELDLRVTKKDPTNAQLNLPNVRDS